MKERLENPKIAALIMAAVMVVFTFIGVRLSMGRLAKSVTQSFFDGVKTEEGYTSASISELLENRITDSLGLITVGANYDSLKAETDALFAAREDLRKALDKKDVHGAYKANSALETSYRALYKGIIGTANEQDAMNADYYADRLRGAGTAISMNGYNGKVDEYISARKAFPVNLFSFILGSSPEYFA